MRNKVLLVAMAVMLAHAVQAQEPVYYHAAGQNLASAIHDVAEGFGLEAQLVDVPPVKLTGVFTPERPDMFFDSMARRFKLDWHLDGRQVFISAQTARQEKYFNFSTPPLRDEFRHLLAVHLPQAGQHFPLRNASKGGTGLLLHAPPSFLAQVENLYDRYQHGHAIAAPGSSEEGVMIFHLRHAWAADKTHHFANGSWTVPGVASLLTGLVGQTSAPQNAAITPTATLAALPEADTPRLGDDATDTAPARTGLPVILPDPRSNAVLIRDRQEKQAYYQSLIARLDRPAALIHIEAMIVDIAKNRVAELGINWQASRGRDSFGFGAASGEASSGDANVALGNGAEGTSLVDDVSSLLARIRFLATKGESRIVSRPSIVTMDNLEAIINTSEKFYVRVEGYQDSSLVPVESGTSLRVTPHLIPATASGQTAESRHIRLLVAIEDGTLDDSDAARVDGLPRVQQHLVQTQAVVKQGSSLLIGGHVHSITAQSRSYVPVLGQIPILGWAFSNSTTTRREFVRLFIIRPRLHGETIPQSTAHP